MMFPLAILDIFRRSVVPTLVGVVLAFLLAPASGFAAEKHLYQRRVDEIFTDKQVQALAKAAAAGDLKTIDVLVKEKGVAVDSQGYLGVTSLWWALQSQNLKGFRRLLELGADPNHQWQQSGNSVMNHVVRMKSPEYLRATLEFGGNPNLLRAWEGGSDTPLFSAMFESPTNDNSATIKLLIESGADVNARSPADNGITPLQVAASMGLWDVMSMLLERGANYMDKRPTGIYPALDYLQSSIERETRLSEEKANQRKQVVNFLTAKGVNLSNYSRSITYPKLGLPYSK